MTRMTANACQGRKQSRGKSDDGIYRHRRRDLERAAFARTLYMMARNDAVLPRRRIAEW